MSLRRFKEDGIIALGCRAGTPDPRERIEIDKIDRLRRDVFAENIEIVAEIEFIHVWAVYCGENIMGTYGAFP